MQFITALFDGSPVAYAAMGVAALVFLLPFVPARWPESRRQERPQKRLAVVEIERVDRDRKVVLVRRDDVEYLLLTGGAAELLIETRSIAPVPIPQPQAIAVTSLRSSHRGAHNI